MTLTNPNGFALGPGAFVNRGELTRTIFQEVQRLNRSSYRTTLRASGISASSDTASAASFAERAAKAMGF